MADQIIKVIVPVDGLKEATEHFPEAASLIGLYVEALHKRDFVGNYFERLPDLIVGEYMEEMYHEPVGSKVIDVAKLYDDTETAIACYSDAFYRVPNIPVVKHLIETHTIADAKPIDDYSVQLVFKRREPDSE